MNRPRLGQRLAPRQQGRFLLAARSRTLELEPADFKALLRRVEEDSLFVRLSGGGLSGGSLIKRHALARMRSHQSAADPDRAATVAAEFDIGTTLAEHAEGVAALRALGVERAGMLLEIEELDEQRESLRDWGVDDESAALLVGLLHHLSISNAMAGSGVAALVPAEPCAPIARFDLAPAGELVIAPLVPYLRTERYAVDYDGIAEAKRAGAFSPAESERLPALLRDLESINHRSDTLHKVLCGLADAQAGFLRSGREEDIAPITQRGLARAVGAQPSAVCRAVRGRSVLTPWGSERALASLFPGPGRGKAQAVAAVISADPGLTDREVAERLYERFGYRVSRRSAALYRGGLSIPNSYQRRMAAAST